jgi:hypothetical protein
VHHAISNSTIGLSDSSYDLLIGVQTQALAGAISLARRIPSARLPIPRFIRPSALGRSLPAPNGSYNVVLEFAEIYFTSVGHRIFNVSINATQVLTSFDIVAAARGPLTAIDKTFAVDVTGGRITIGLFGLR